jgi:hypothetical protein
MAASVRLAATAGLLLALAAGLSSCRRKELPPIVVAPTPAPPPTPTPPPAPYVPNKRMEVGKMFNGLHLRTHFETEYGTTATNDRNTPESYALDITLRVRIPKPHRDLAELAKLNPELPNVLPGLPVLLDTAKVSPAFDELYRLKTGLLQTNLRTRLDLLLSRHNFYDTETVLDLEHPLTKRTAILVQSDMDTDMDGSDSDRVPDVDGSSATFQPMTSYNWPKKTKQPNSFIVPREKQLKEIGQELAKPGVAAARQKELKDTAAHLRMEIANLQKNSFLVAALDPFIVLPGSMFGKKDQLAPRVGDYCVVIHKDVLYPAIVGDVGPRYKSGEASLRLCKELNPKASAYNRPASDLKVTYLVFPGTGERPWDVPKLDRWREQCEKLLADLGGYNGTLFTWADLTMKPEPEPSATPAPTETSATSPVDIPPGATPAPQPGSTPTPAATPATGSSSSAAPAPATPVSATPATTPKPKATPKANGGKGEGPGAPSREKND